MQVYYFAMVEDLVLRFIWSVNNTLGQMDIGRGRNGLIITTMLSFLEVIRYDSSSNLDMNVLTPWGRFHLETCAQFMEYHTKAVRYLYRR